MRSKVTLTAATLFVICGAAGPAAADSRAELVSTALVWDRDNHATNPDLIRFGDQWVVACQESKHLGYPGGIVRLLISDDGEQWESAALLECPSRKRGLYVPSLTRTMEGRLMVSALGGVVTSDPADPIYYEAGMQKTLAWISQDPRLADARAWVKPELIGLNNFPLNRVVWHKGTAFSPSIGAICGIAQTLQIMASDDGRKFASRAEEELSMIMPYEAELLFEGDTAYCVATGYSTTGPTAVLGVSNAPYTSWNWNELDQSLRNARFLRLPDERVMAAAWLHGENPRLSLCEFQPKTGMFTELLELTASGEPAAAGLAWHDGHLWVCYPFAEGDKTRLHLAKVKLE
jgi:hypothetical protein